MTTNDAVEEIFDEVDTNRDGRIDKDELRNWASKPDEVTTFSHESSACDISRDHNTTGWDDRYRSKVGSQSTLEFTTDKVNSYDTTITSRNFISEKVIRTSSADETNRYLATSVDHIYKDLNPKIIRRAATDRPVTYEQRVLVRYLQPPPLPPPEPLIIKEVRPEQPPPPPPLVIHEQSTHVSQAPPLILRERPPIPPPRCSSETSIRYLPPLPAPPRSVVIERYPAPPAKPRDIVIERWLPYGAQSERRTIVQPAPPPIEYPKPSYTIVAYDNVQIRIVRKLEKLGVTQENPEAYVARYGNSLLDSATLVQEARNAGVVEDISTPLSSSSTITHRRVNTVGFDHSNEIINQDYSSSAGTTYEGHHRVTGGETIALGSRTYSSSSGSHLLGHSTSSGNITEIQGGYRVGDAAYRY
ncbi:unnamed protein product [Rotaria magnacalcarata]|uniref:EF-hand domain-containing protein n=1 Tax=Rotaria magnacalcarata TaxID=392030 RepID=A0A815FU20_9BILA|nr:unnamed protein product [Rotaria magnacalcarata]CAF1686914.1 unnamed protein product [Rotaria magnacalcarata]CAF3997105.1 unnamed protein product [Rotaria magnacalcarata]CAF4028346.1 unnamed protein product [Rotaria magnacalcarata]